MQNDLDGAEVALTPTLELAAPRRTARLVQRLTTLRAAVDASRCRTTPVARRIAIAVDDYAAGALTQAERHALPAGR
jgi:hypothetical protein